MSGNYKKLGEYIEVLNRRNTDLKLGLDSVRGISNTKQITETSKATVDESVISKFYVINPGEFVYNPRTTRMGDKVGLAFNNTDKPLLFTFNNLAFRIKDSAKDKLLPDYLYLFFCRSEFDRYARINSWGSATELFLFEDLCNIKFAVPDLKEQEKIVNTYNAITKRIQLKQKINENLEKTAQCLFDKTIKQKEKNGKLQDIAEINSGKRPDEMTDGNFPLVGAGDIMGYISNFNYDGKTLVIGRVGTHGKVQRFNEKCWCSDNTLTIKSNLYEYTYFILKNIDYSLLNRGSTQPLITQTDIKDFDIYYSENDVNEFEDVASKLMNTYDENKSEIKKLQELKKLVISCINRM